MLNSFIFNYDTPEKDAERAGYAGAVRLSLPDFLEKYKAGIEKVTAADVTRVANKYVDVNKLAIVVVGQRRSEFGGPLAGLGTVQNVDIAIPPPPGRKVAAGRHQQSPCGIIQKVLRRVTLKIIQGAD